MDPFGYLQHMWQLAAQGQLQGVWFWAALYTFLICAYSLYFQLRTRYWPSTNGSLVALGVRKFGGADRVPSNQDYVSSSLYEYEVAGVKYEGKRISPWIFVASHNARFVLEKQLSAVQRLPDGGVKVFYNPRNPRKSWLIVAGKVGIAVTFVIAVVPALSYYLRFYG